MIDKGKCKVCNKELSLEKEKRYTAYDDSMSGPIARMFIQGKMYDAFDCPCCGCQNIVNDRLKIANEGEKLIAMNHNETEYDEQ